MKIKNYCMVILDNVEGIKEEILPIAESNPKYIDAESLVMTTFKSALSAEELKDYFKSYERSFVLFEMGKSNYGAFITKKSLNDHLFAKVELEMDNTVQNKIADAVERIKDKRVKVKEKEVKLNINFSKLTLVERTKMTDELIDKGIENWTDKDKEIMEKLSNI